MSIYGDRGGGTYDGPRDRDRLNKQMRDVYLAVLDGDWHTLGGLSLRTGHPEASVSARLRDLRKTKFGGYLIEREYRGNGLWAYRLTGRKGDPA